MKSKFAILIRMISIIVFSAQMITAQESRPFLKGFFGGNNHSENTNSSQRQKDEYDLLYDDIALIFHHDPDYFRQNGVYSFKREIPTCSRVANIYFASIYQLLYPIVETDDGDKNTCEGHFIAFISSESLLKEYCKASRNELHLLTIPIDPTDRGKKTVYTTQLPFLKQNIEARKKICESLYPNDDWRTLLTKVQMDIQRQNRKSWFRTWYLTNFQNDLNFQKSSPELRDFIFKNYLEIPANGYGTDEANCLLNWKENSGLQEFLDSEDCQQRPWYVADQFFQFMNLERFRKCKEYGDLCKFLPKNSSELGWNRGFLRNDQYTEKISLAVKNWLILKFGYSEDSPELQDRDLPQLLALLKENFEAVRPYHRFLYDQIQDEEVKKFLNYFIN